MVNTATGDLREDHTLPPTQFLGQSFAPRLVYHSATANPRVIVPANADYGSTIKPATAQDKVTVNGIEFAGPVRSVASAPGNKFRYATQVDLTQVPSGFVNVGYATRGSYGAAAITSRTSFPQMVNNQSGSALGAGWMLDLPISGGFGRLLPQSGGGVVALDGNGSSRLHARGKRPPFNAWAISCGCLVGESKSLTPPLYRF